MEKEKSFAKTIQLVETAMSQNAHSTIPQLDLDVALTYIFSPPEIGLKKTGEIYGRTLEWARQKRDTTIKTLHSNTNPEIQHAFPLEGLSFNKPIVRKTKEKVVFSKKKTERNPNFVHEEQMLLIESLKSATTDEEKQRLLNLVTRGLYRKYARGDDPLFIPVRRLVADAGFHVRKMEEIALFRDTIKSANIPIGEIVYQSKKSKKILRYSFILSNENDKDRATQALHNNDDLKRFLTHPVSQVAGPTQEHLPSTTLMRNNKKFRSVYSLLNSLRSKQVSFKKQFTKLFENPELIPVPIYHHEDSYRYQAKEHKKLRRYAARILQAKAA